MVNENENENPPLTLPSIRHQKNGFSLGTWQPGENHQKCVLAWPHLPLPPLSLTEMKSVIIQSQSIVKRNHQIL